MRVARGEGGALHWALDGANRDMPVLAAQAVCTGAIEQIEITT